MGEKDLGKHSLFREDVIRELFDQDTFISLITLNFNEIANRVGCEVTLSKRRLIEAYDFWRADEKRTLSDGIQRGTTELDHFKHGAFMAFWLRRMIPINETRILPQYANPSESMKARQRFFLRYGNEICALLIGYQICLNYETARHFSGENGSKVRPIADRPALLRRSTLPQDLLANFAMVLKHKNMSPHSLYLLYRSLFSGRSSFDG